MANVLVWFASVLVFLIASCEGSSVIVKKGDPVTLECTFSNNVTSITWQLSIDSGLVNLSTCNVVSSKCTDFSPSEYHGFILRSGNENVFGVNVTSARLNETDFDCLADNGETLNVTIDVYDSPVIAKIYADCPYGNGMRDLVFPIGSTAFCECYLDYEDVPNGVARWFTRDGHVVGDESTNNGIASSVLNVTYDYRDPNPSFECRAVNSLNISVKPFVYSPLFTNDYRAAELDKPFYLGCSFQENVTSVTWRILKGYRMWNITTCSVVDNICTDLMPTFYKGTISSSGDNTTVGLNFIRVIKNETIFSCLADNGMKSNITQLNIYSRPSKPQCKQLMKEYTIQYSCTTDFIYPRLSAQLHRRGLDFTQENDVHISYNSYDDGAIRSANITSDVFIYDMSGPMKVYLELVAEVSGHVLVNSSAVYSDDIFTDLRMPVPVLNSAYCPFGPGVHGNRTRIGTKASCKCNLQYAGKPPGQAQWFSMTGYPLNSVDNKTDGSSTMNFTYDAKDPKKSYVCKPHSEFQGNDTSLIYTPTFISSALSIDITDLQFTVIILGVIAAVLVSHTS